MRRGFKTREGFNLTEVTIMLAFVGILVVTAFPSVIQSSSNNSSLMKAKNMAAKIQAARLKYDAMPPAFSAGGSTEKSILQLTNYASLKTSGSIDGYACGIATSNTPCFRYADGSIIQPLAASGAGISKFAFWADGGNGVPTLELWMNYNTARVAPSKELGSAFTDPDYVKPWTQR